MKKLKHCDYLLQPNLYPTVGLQTPGEVVDANFGQHPFVFDIEDYMREWRTKIQAQIDRFPIGDREGEWQTMIQKYDFKYCEECLLKFLFSL